MSRTRPWGDTDTVGSIPVRVGPEPRRPLSEGLQGFLRTCLALVLASAAACGPGDADPSPDPRGEAAPVPQPYRGEALAVPIEKVDFLFTDTGGEPYDFRERTDGYVTLLFFGYTRCPDVCPIHLTNLAAVLKELPPELSSQVRTVFVTTDPEYDTPRRLRTFLNMFDKRFVGLRGTRDEANRVLADLGLPPAVVMREDEHDFVMGHPAAILGFGRDGLAHVTYPFGVRQADWAHDLPLLIREGQSAP